MVILNASVGIILKAISTYSTIYDLSSLVKFTNERWIPYFRSLGVVRFCWLDWTCQMIERLSFFLYAISLGSLTFFYYHFDKKFKSAFDLVIRHKQQQNQNLAKK